MEDSRSKHGEFGWNELTTTDPKAAKAFYSELFGWTTEEMPMEGMSYTIIKAGSEMIGGIAACPQKAQSTPPSWGAYVTVNDVDATAKKAAALGGKILVPPTDIPTVGRFTVIQDPQGAVISAITYLPRP